MRKVILLLVSLALVGCSAQSSSGLEGSQTSSQLSGIQDSDIIDVWVNHRDIDIHHHQLTKENK